MDSCRASATARRAFCQIDAPLLLVNSRGKLLAFLVERGEFEFGLPLLDFALDVGQALLALGLGLGEVGVGLFELAFAVEHLPFKFGRVELEDQVADIYLLSFGPEVDDFESAADPRRRHDFAAGRAHLAPLNVRHGKIAAHDLGRGQVGRCALTGAQHEGAKDGSHRAASSTVGQSLSMRPSRKRTMRRLAHADIARSLFVRDEQDCVLPRHGVST